MSGLKLKMEGGRFGPACFVSRFPFASPADLSAFTVTPSASHLALSVPQRSQRNIESDARNGTAICNSRHFSTCELQKAFRRGMTLDRKREIGRRNRES
jgi:hypothetical protein